MLICGYQSIVDVTTGELVAARGGRGVTVEFKVHVESYGFTVTRPIRVERGDVRAFVAQLRTVERDRHASATLSSTPPDAFELRIGFAGDSGRATVNGRLRATGKGEDAATLGFAFDFDPATLPTIVAEAERWIAPLRDERAIAFERQFLAWLHIRFGILPEPRWGTNAQWWAFEYEKVTVSFVIVGRSKNGSIPPPPGVDWLLRVEEPDPCTFIERVQAHFEPGSAARRRMSSGRVRVQFKSTALRQPFVDQADTT